MFEFFSNCNFKLILLEVFIKEKCIHQSQIQSQSQSQGQGQGQSQGQSQDQGQSQGQSQNKIISKFANCLNLKYKLPWILYEDQYF